MSIAGYMSTAYAIIMLAVTVGIVVQTSQDSWTSPNAMFIIVITAIYVLAGLLHPEEFMCLMPGVLYFLCIPSGIYSMVYFCRSSLIAVSAVLQLRIISFHSDVTTETWLRFVYTQHPFSDKTDFCSLS